MDNILQHPPIPIIGFAAYSGTGKTTLLKQIINELSQTINIGLIKQSHHDIDIDMPGKDSYELRKAGAAQTLLTSPYRSVLIKEHKEQQEPELGNIIKQLDIDKLDLVLVEGFKQTSFTKIEVYRKELDKPLLYPDDKNIIAIATNDTETSHSIPKLDLNNPDQIIDYIRQHFL